MTPRTTARPTIVRTRLPPVLALCAAVLRGVARRGDQRGVSPSAAKATGAVSRQPKAAAVKKAWRVRIKPEEVLSPGSAAQGSYRQVGSRPEVGIWTFVLRPAVRCRVCLLCGVRRMSTTRSRPPRHRTYPRAPSRAESVVERRVESWSRAVPATRRFPRGVPHPLEAQLVDHRAAEHDQRQHVEPHQRDQHEHRAGADPQRRGRSRGRPGTRSPGRPVGERRRQRPRPHAAPRDHALGHRGVGDAQRGEEDHQAERDRRPVHEVALRRRARTAGRSAPVTSSDCTVGTDDARRDEHQHHHQHPEAEQLLAHPRAARQVVDAAERRVQRAPEGGADPQRGDQGDDADRGRGLLEPRGSVDQRALGRAREDRARVGDARTPRAPGSAARG